MTLPDALSIYHPQPGPEIALDIAIHHAHLTTQPKNGIPGGNSCRPRAVSSGTNHY